MSVVKKRLRMSGVKGLMVADGSVKVTTPTMVANREMRRLPIVNGMVGQYSVRDVMDVLLDLYTAHEIGGFNKKRDYIAVWPAECWAAAAA